MGRKSRRKRETTDPADPPWFAPLAAKRCNDVLELAKGDLHPAALAMIVSGLRDFIDQVARLNDADPEGRSNREALLPVGSGLGYREWLELEEKLEHRIRTKMDSSDEYLGLVRDLRRLAAHGSRFPDHAEAFVISPEMHNVVVAAALTLTAEDLFTLDPEVDPPTPAGMLLLPTSTAKSERYASVSVIGWQQLDGQVLTEYPRRQGVWMEGWAQRQDIELTSGWRFAVQTSRNVGVRPPIALPFTFTWMFGDRVGERERAVLRAVEEQADELRRVSLDTEVSAEYDPQQEVEFGIDRYLFAFWKLYATGTSSVERADGEPLRRQAGADKARRAVERPVDRVRIVRLRDAGAGDGNGQSPRYSHRWPVRIHKVNQYYPSTDSHRVRFRGPYIKGPDGAPLLIGPKAQGIV